MIVEGVVRPHCLSATLTPKSVQALDHLPADQGNGRDERDVLD